MSQPLYIVSHIPKTAGSTLRGNFELNFGGAAWVPADVPGDMEWDEIAGEKSPLELKAAVDGAVRKAASSDARCIFGHWAYYGIHETLHAGLQSQFEPRYITFLREPIARVVSMFRYNARTARTTSHQEIEANSWSLEEWYERSGNHRRRNGQVRHLLMGDHTDIMQREQLTSAEFDEAKARLKRFWFVGLTETFTEDAAYLFGKLNFTKFLLQEALNASEGRAKVTAEQERLLTNGNEMDLELYQLGQELRERNIARAADFAATLEKARRARSRSDFRGRTLAPVKRLLKPGNRTQVTPA